MLLDITIKEKKLTAIAMDTEIFTLSYVHRNTSPKVNYEMHCRKITR